MKVKKISQAKRPLHITATILFALYLALLFRLTVFRDDFSVYNFLMGGKFNIIPLRNMLKCIKYDGWRYFVGQVLGNIAAFVPFGGYLALVTDKKMYRIVVDGALLCIAIELLQFAFAVGVTDVDDLILNAFGTFLGALTVFLTVGIIRFIKKKKKRR